MIPKQIQERDPVDENGQNSSSQKDESNLEKIEYIKLLDFHMYLYN